MNLQDLRLAVRLWWRNPWFAALTAVGLGLGIGVNNTFFALTNAAVIRGLPIEQADRVMFLGSLDARTSETFVRAPPPCPVWPRSPRRG